MMTSDEAFVSLCGRLGELLVPGAVGYFDHLELTEIVGTPKGGATLNVLSIAVLGEGRTLAGDQVSKQFLTGRVRIEGFKDWSFGVARTVLPVAALHDALENFRVTRQWNLSGMPLGTGDLRPEPGIFAPPDGTRTVPLNKVLKNNFWAGSHVFRLFDRDKTALAPFFADRRRLQALSDAVAAAVPMAFAGLADLLGDVLIQVPVTILVPTIRAPRHAQHSEVSVSWRRGSAPRALTVAARTRSDGLLTGAAFAERFGAGVQLPVSRDEHALETEIWDADTRILLGATAPTSTIATVRLAMHVAEHEPRIFTVPDREEQSTPVRVALQTNSTSSSGHVDDKGSNNWLRRRQDLEERRRLEETRDFVQYRPTPGSHDERTRAYDDIRFLINKHGHEGVDLWDPYLSGEDLLHTLFWCTHSDVSLRGLTDGRVPPIEKLPCPGPLPDPKTPNPSFLEEQRSVLEQGSGNRQGLNLEYRTRRGPKGWAFHDRFLIFPRGEEGPLAWSLGTSVNSLGLAHHILQRVANPALVAGAFEDLWSALDGSDHLIWKS